MEPGVLSQRTSNAYTKESNFHGEGFFFGPVEQKTGRDLTLLKDWVCTPLIHYLV